MQAGSTGDRCYRKPGWPHVALGNGGIRLGPLELTALTACLCER